MVAQPVGRVTLLFTDVEGSTRLLERLGTELYAELLEGHRRLLREAFERYEGYEFGTEGDALFVAFARADDAVAAAGEGQRVLAEAEWPEGVELRVRMGLHTGEPSVAGSNYVGVDLHRVARIMSAGHGGQVVVSAVTRALVDDELIELGEHRFEGLDGRPDRERPRRDVLTHGSGLQCTTQLASPSCASCAGGDLTVEFKGTGPGKTWVATSSGGYWQNAALPPGQVSLTASAEHDRVRVLAPVLLTAIATASSALAAHPTSPSPVTSTRDTTKAKQGALGFLTPPSATEFASLVRASTATSQPTR